MSRASYDDDANECVRNWINGNRKDAAAILLDSKWTPAQRIGLAMAVCERLRSHGISEQRAFRVYWAEVHEPN